MKWYDKRYHTLDYELKQTFGQKVIKLSLDGGFTCPNRDGRIGTRGCIFCGEKGSGDFAGTRDVSIAEQVEQQKQLLSSKWPDGKYIAYFQSYTNTYAPLDRLRTRYEDVLSCKDVVGLAVATRPDCLPDDVLSLLEEIAGKTFMWIELGLQTIHPGSAAFIRRGYDLSCFSEAVAKLKERNIRVVVHMIIGLPGESREDILDTVRLVAKLGVWGVKFHMLYIQKDTDLYEYYCSNPFSVLTLDEYVNIIADALEILPPEIVVHRVTGDGVKRLLEAPLWTLDKLKVLSEIDRVLRERNSYQGCRQKV
ncbi:MAG: TIGR01212 family radical SAM protein [Clostridium sp.]|jgi:radical SAM protein (TIGR01212 family)|nr:TIGR01212 family radical SAM protein [Clostridium sp.]